MAKSVSKAITVILTTFLRVSLKKECRYSIYILL